MNLSFPDFGDAQAELEKIAKKVIVADIEGRMKAGINLSGGSHKANARSTRINKGLRGLRTAVPLIASGQLLGSFRINLIGDKTVQIMPRGTRSAYPDIISRYRMREQTKVGHTAVQKHLKKVRQQEITPTNYELADILQNQGVHGYKYEFFGISDEAEGKAMEQMFKYIKKAIKDGVRKPV